MNRWALLMGSWLLPLIGVDIDRVLGYIENPGRYHDGQE